MSLKLEAEIFMESLGGGLGSHYFSLVNISQPWLHMRSIWGNLENNQCWGSTLDQLSQNLRGSGPSTDSFKKAPEIILMCRQH